MPIGPHKIGEKYVFIDTQQFSTLLLIEKRETSYELLEQCSVEWLGQSVGCVESAWYVLNADKFAFDLLLHESERYIEVLGFEAWSVAVDELDSWFVVGDNREWLSVENAEVASKSLQPEKLFGADLEGE